MFDLNTTLSMFTLLAIIATAYYTRNIWLKEMLPEVDAYIRVNKNYPLFILGVVNSGNELYDVEIVIEVDTDCQMLIQKLEKRHPIKLKKLSTDDTYSINFGSHDAAMREIKTLKIHVTGMNNSKFILGSKKYQKTITIDPSYLNLSEFNRCTSDALYGMQKDQLKFEEFVKQHLEKIENRKTSNIPDNSTIRPFARKNPRKR